jgi:hypothetical protein
LKKRPVLKLVYHTGVFGPIDLEYEGPVVRVGRSEDNDLVLRHPSVAPHHCLLVFRGEKMLCFPPDSDITAQTDLARLPGPEYGAGIQLEIGDLFFTLAHSTRSVAIPEVQRKDASDGGAEGDLATGASEGTGRRRYYCAHCRAFVQDTEVKRLGLVSHAKRYLCPKCSGVLDVEPETPKQAPGRKKWFRHGALNRTSTSPAKP